ncbi:DNA sulfur modification protein DndB [Streptomyces sp. NBC_00996]|uniref:DNA sulfur modification protein DndB n=1 Tax=Streptomyces sp. NBC_00996 TaxID=2903710 RepID=UPI00386AA7B6|nr:hypothetical protein OG390_28835 [Streptomyces sp. NBC_00996]
MTITVDSSRFSLVREESTYLAIRTGQGGRTVYSTRIPLADLSVILTIPDPAKPDPDNRKVDIAHAKGFGQYLADNPGWVAPALLIRDTGGCRFEPISEDGSVGYLTVPWSITPGDRMPLVHSTAPVAHLMAVGRVDEDGAVGGVHDLSASCGQGGRQFLRR